jgi:hypothetical protein
MPTLMDYIAALKGQGTVPLVYPHGGTPGYGPYNAIQNNAQFNGMYRATPNTVLGPGPFNTPAYQDSFMPYPTQGHKR